MSRVVTIPPPDRDKVLGNAEGKLQEAARRHKESKKFIRNMQDVVEFRKLTGEIKS